MSTVVAWLLPALLAAASDSLARFTFREVHLGMEIRITGYAPNDSAARAGAAAAFAEIARLEDIFSDWRPGSEVRRLEGSPGTWHNASPELMTVLGTALEVARATDGAFDPTVGPLTMLWREARRTRVMPDSGQVDQARRAVGYQWLHLDTVQQRVRLARPGMRLDLGGVAKGYILQQAVGVLTTHGLPRVLVEAGGDVVAGEAPPGKAGWTVDTPLAGPDVARAARLLRHAALATSGPTTQFINVEGRRYSHVVDPRTGAWLTSRGIGTVHARSALTADALATALTVLPRASHASLLHRFGATGSVRVP